MALVGGLVFTPLRGGAMGLATATTASISTLVFTLILRSRWGQIGLRSILTSLARILAATAAMCAAIIGGMTIMMGTLENTSNTQAGFVLMACIPAGAVVFLAAAWLLRSTELKELYNAVTHKSAKNAE
jgi:peptidoglycan biosynthesis protein MviN/MurJ (putative lipid II flippase)